MKNNKLWMMIFIILFVGFLENLRIEREPNSYSYVNGLDNKGNETETYRFPINQNGKEISISDIKKVPWPGPVTLKRNIDTTIQLKSRIIVLSNSNKNMNLINPDTGKEEDVNINKYSLPTSVK